MHPSTAHRLSALLAAQHSVVSTAQLVALGVDHELPAREGWTLLGPAVWLTEPGAQPDDRQLLTAGRLCAGRRGVATGALVCRLLGLRDVPPVVGTDVLLPHGTRRRSGAHVRLRQTRRLPEPVLLEGYRAAPLHRAVADAARWCDDLGAVRALVLAAADGWPLQGLEADVRDGGRARSALLRRALVDLERGARSAPEAEAADHLLAVRGAPPFLLNPLLAVDGVVLGRPDGWFVGTGLGWEVDSVRHHGGSRELEHTLQRHGRFADRGLTLLHVTPARLRSDGRVWARDVVRRARASAPVPGLTLRGAGAVAA